MIKINKAILHILDFNSGITVFSEKELDVENTSVSTFLTKHIEKSFNDTNLKSGAFLESSRFKIQMLNYINSELNFISFSTYIADIIQSYISMSDKLESIDLIICDFNIEDNRSVGILECLNRVGFTHQVINENDKIKNEIINYHAILPNLSQRLDEFAFVDINTCDINFISKKRYIEGKDTFLLPDILLECSSNISPRDAIKLVDSITCSVAENHGKNSAIAISKAKNFLKENLDLSECLEPMELCKEVFFESEIMQDEFIKEVKDAGIPDTMKLGKSLVVKTSKNHKIKTDTGIEITFPVDYFNNKEYIDFINNPDGTLSIELKNIGKIINK